MSRKMSVAKQEGEINAEYERLKNTLAGISEEKLTAADSLLHRCAFMAITLELLENDVKAQGPTIPFTNGKQKLRVENPAQKSYNVMIARYTAAVDKLLNLLPNNEPTLAEQEPQSDGFDEFVEERGE